MDFGGSMLRTLFINTWIVEIFMLDLHVSNAMSAIMNIYFLFLVKGGIRDAWASLIQKVYHIDSLLFPKCNGKMRIISFIDDNPTIRKILIHLNLWMTGNHDPPVPSKPAPLDYPTLKTENLYGNPFETIIENTAL